MSPADLFFLLRRHRWVLVVAVLTGLVAGWLTAPGDSDEPQEFEASHTLIINRDNQTAELNLQQAALLTGRGEVPRAAATAIGVDVGTITRVVDAVADLPVSAITITGRSQDAALAENAANAVATALVEKLTGDNQRRFEGRVAELREQESQLRARIAEGGTGAEAQAEAQAAQTQLTNTLQQLNALIGAGGPAPPLVTVEAAEAKPASDDGISAPTSKPARAALLAGFGLLLGLGAVFALDRLDTRIHTKNGAEAAFGFPVIAEIPPLPSGATRTLLSESRPASQFVEAYRGLRTHIALADKEHGLRPPAEGDGSVIVVTSPLAGEGKTTSVAHVAAMFGEVGRSVLVVSGDFRRPRAHELFGRERGPGLTEVLGGAPNAPDIADLDLDTNVKGVQFLTSGAPVSNPAVVVKRTPALLQAAQPYWEFVIVDSAPILVANDTAELARAANGVVVLARSGRTTVDAAQRTAELLRRIDAPVLGIVLIAANESPTAYRYYRKSYYGEHDGKGGSRWRRARGRAPGKARGGKDPSPPSNGRQAWVPGDRPPSNVPS